MCTTSTFPLSGVWFRSHSQGCGPGSTLRGVVQVPLSGVWFRSHSQGCGSGPTLRGVVQVPLSGVWSRFHSQGCGPGPSPRKPIYISYTITLTMFAAADLSSLSHYIPPRTAVHTMCVCAPVLNIHMRKCFDVERVS